MRWIYLPSTYLCCGHCRHQNWCSLPCKLGTSSGRSFPDEIVRTLQVSGRSPWRLQLSLSGKTLHCNVMSSVFIIWQSRITQWYTSPPPITYYINKELFQIKWNNSDIFHCIERQTNSTLSWRWTQSCEFCKLYLCGLFLSLEFYPLLTSKDTFYI